MLRRAPPSIRHIFHRRHEESTSCVAPIGAQLQRAVKALLGGGVRTGHTRRQLGLSGLPRLCTVVRQVLFKWTSYILFYNISKPIYLFLLLPSRRPQTCYGVR